MIIAKIKCLLGILLCFLFIVQQSIASQDHIKMYVMYTPSHEMMFHEWFLPSLQDDFEVVVEEEIQQCRSGSFLESGWNDTMLKKVDLIIHAIKENWHKIFIHADVDIQFFGKTKDMIFQAMQGYDMAFQRDTLSGELCAGFFACVGNERTLSLWQDIKALLISLRDYYYNSAIEVNDQRCLNKLIHEPKYGVKFRFLPNQFFSYGLLGRDQRWYPGVEFPVPQDIVMHHANWTVGPEHKLELLRYVRHSMLK